MLATPKKVRPTRERPELIEDVVATVRASTKLKSVARLSEVSDGKLTVAGLQALFDESMKEFLPSLPRMIVTQKAFGVFRKRVEAAGVDLQRFATFAVREWRNLASQNRAAFMRDPSRAKKGSPLPEAPNFTTLAYRLPYFLAAYANTEAIGKRVEVLDPKDAEIRRLQKQLADAQSQVRSSAAVVRRIKTVQREEPPPATKFRRVPAVKSLPVDIDDGWTPPAWEPSTK